MRIVFPYSNILCVVPDYAASLYPSVAKAENAVAPRKASKGEAVVCYRQPLATQEMQYCRLSQRVNEMMIFIRFLDFTMGDVQIAHYAFPIYL